jgi:PAS domain S-box-containing protein
MCISGLVPIRDDGGAIVGCKGTTQDLVGQKQAEEAMPQSQESFAGLFEHAMLGLYGTSSDGRILMANQAMCGIFGYSSFEDLVQCNFNNNPTYSRSRFLEELAEKSRVARLESIWTKLNGDIVNLRESARAVHDASGALMYFEGIVEDITDQKRAEEDLRKSEERYQRITEAITDYIYTVRKTGAGGWETTYGPGCLAITGYQTNEYAYDPLLWIRRVVEADRSRVEEQVKRILAGEDPPPVEHRIIHKN